ncbi:MAG: TetR/AcrR family transcriptional regulator [Lachnospiraceae bacterium]|nr:TetR/AcrR family transcriptional regulator [Lachnospiraceae bacterium]
MSEKSISKRNYILEQARSIFCKKGYASTTMKDVVEACDVSRGGVYLYFNNIRELFEEVMAAEFEGEGDFGDRIPEDASFADVLALFVKEQKRAILSKKPSLTVAIYEYYFGNKVSGKNNLLKKYFDMSVYVLEELIREGVEAGEFYDIDPHRAASNLMYVIEGLKVASKTRGVSEAAVDEEIIYVMQGIIAED